MDIIFVFLVSYQSFISEWFVFGPLERNFKWFMEILNVEIGPIDFKNSVERFD